MKSFFNLDILQKVLLYGLAFVFFVAILPKAAFQGDMSFWLEWTGWIHDHGLGKIYNYNTDYHPLFLYGLHLFQWIMGSMAEVKAHLNYVKVIPLVFDFIGALSVFFILKNEKNALIYPFFLLFNIGYMYNTSLWGQIDSIHSAFILLSIIFVLKKMPLWSVAFFLLALNTKLQSIIYLPIIGLLLLPYFTQSYKTVLKSLGLILSIQFIIFLPFILNGSIDGFWRVLTTAQGRYPQVSMNAFNFWFYFFDLEVVPDLGKVKDADEFALGVSYKTWGLSLFLLFSTISLFPLLKHCFYWVKEKLVPSERFIEMAFLTAGLITIVFFYFNTQMHERYSHTAIIMFFFYGVMSKRYFLFIISSFATLFNMEKVLKVWDFNNYVTTLVFDEVFISSLFLLIILNSIFRLYWSYFKLEIRN